MSQTNQQLYRTGLICEAGGVSYWHTGAQYWIAVDSADGAQIDLREFQGFKKLDERFSRSTSIFFDGLWEAIAESEPEIAAARKVLQDRSEPLWWKLVSEFLEAHHSANHRRAQAARVLRDSGMDEATINSILVA